MHPLHQLSTDTMAIAVEQPLRPLDNFRSPPYLNQIVHGSLAERNGRTLALLRMPWVVARRRTACQDLLGWGFSQMPHEQGLSVAAEERHDQIAAAERSAVILRP